MLVLRSCDACLGSHDAVLWGHVMLVSLQGVGMDMKDPFEMFRKNMSYTFNRRERAPR